MLTIDWLTSRCNVCGKHEYYFNMARCPICRLMMCRTDTVGAEYDSVLDSDTRLSFICEEDFPCRVCMEGEW